MYDTSIIQRREDFLRRDNIVVINHLHSAYTCAKQMNNSNNKNNNKKINIKNTPPRRV